MIVADIPDGELERLQALFNTGILDTPPESDFDQLTELAASICDTPIALVSLVDEKRQWFKSRFGLDATETPRDYAFCAHAINQEDVFEIHDSREDERFHDNPLVTDDPRVIFYAGAPLVTCDGHKLGTVCVIDNKPHLLNAVQRRQLTIISRQVMALIECYEAVQLKKQAFNELMAITTKTTLQNRELSQFSTRASHDIQGPIRQIKQLAHMCQQDLEEGNVESVANDCQTIISRCDDLSGFVSRVFELTGLSADVKKTEEIKFKRVVLAAIANNELLIEQKGVEVGYEVDVETPFFSEQVRILQILNNLISNGVKYSHPERSPKTLSVSVTEQDGYIVISVKDNGLGIPKEYHSRLFEQFSRFHVDSAAGTGLGMSIVQKHVQMLGGEISLESSEYGTQFDVRLPISGA